ncbi:MAG TPA: Uma2 family endonuclease [Isosphaeraceae bacterium]|jgi:Uma2 family endonuclease|nr:Uma2 family endonuclease [Isosphaeraceae bacterium]
MSARIELLPKPEVEYPETDGEPIAENTLQYRWIVTIHGGIGAVFATDPNVFVAADLFWYPVEGDNKIRLAPDTMVVFGRPKGDRGSYLQWREDGIAPQVVFEVLSPGNRAGEMQRKFEFYEKFGVEEYYIYDPDRVVMTGWLRAGDTFRPIPDLDGWVSPRLGIRFDLSGEELAIFMPDGRPFPTFMELFTQRDELAQQRDELAQQRDELAQQRDEALRRAERLAERLRALGIDPEG